MRGGTRDRNIHSIAIIHESPVVPEVGPGGQVDHDACLSALAGVDGGDIETAVGQVFPRYLPHPLEVQIDAIEGGTPLLEHVFVAPVVTVPCVGAMRGVVCSD
eukprot:3459123-Pyramimonas_sp.AAC.1